MAEELTFKDEAAALYDEAFAHVTAYFMPFLLQAAGAAPGMRVLDIATGTGLSAGAALAAVGPTGHITAVDISPAMVAKARERLGDAPNVALSVEDGQALPFPDESFDAVLCNLGLMFFPDPVRGLMEFRRVLRPGGRMAVSVNTVVERSYNHQINVMIARYVPGLAESVAHTFALAEASKLRLLFDAAGFVDFMGHVGAFSGDVVTGWMRQRYDWAGAIAWWAFAAFIAAGLVATLWRARPAEVQVAPAPAPGAA